MVFTNDRLRASRSSVLHRRRGATVVEFAIVYPLALLLVVGITVGGLGTFRYQQVAHLAHLGARYASVRGGQYEAETGQTAASQQNVLDYVRSQGVAIDTNAVTIEIFLNVTSLDASGNPTVNAEAWDTSNKAPYQVVSDKGNARQNTISVTVRYRWLPEAFLVGPITLTSTATIPMQY